VLGGGLLWGGARERGEQKCFVLKRIVETICNMHAASISAINFFKPPHIGGGGLRMHEASNSALILLHYSISVGHQPLASPPPPLCHCRKIKKTMPNLPLKWP